MNCPKCKIEMKSGLFSDVPVHHCGQCDGKLLNQMKLMPFMRALASEANIPYQDIQLKPKTKEASYYACPKCDSQMEKFGYMGTNKVYIDNCFSCRLIWTDNEELTEMCILFLQTNSAISKHAELSERHVQRMASIVDAAMRSQAVSLAFAHRFAYCGIF